MVSKSGGGGATVAGCEYVGRGEAGFATAVSFCGSVCCCAVAVSAPAVNELDSGLGFFGLWWSTPADGDDGDDDEYRREPDWPTPFVTGAC